MSAPLDTVSDATFESEILAADGLVLVDFWATWSSPCRTMMPVVEEVAEEYAAAVRVVAVDVRAAPKAVERFGGRNVPLLVIFEDGAIRARMAGATSRARLRDFIEANVGIRQ